MSHFDNVGLYDALFVMQDQETKTLWNHITGEALYGPLVGTSLGPIGNLFQLSVEQALLRDPSMPIAISNSPYFVNSQAFGATGPLAAGGRGMGGRRLNDDSQLSAAFAGSLGAEDDRLGRMELGLGIVTNDTVRFYTLDAIRNTGSLIDVVDGRNMLVFMDQTTFTPAALFVDAASAAIEDQEVRLDTGEVVRLGLLFDAAGNRVMADRPQQLFSRWYGFSMTFPESQIYGR